MATAEQATSETERNLVQLARGRFGNIAPERIAGHVAWVTSDADWPVSKAALEALVRRRGFAERDKLKVLVRPGGNRVLGGYRVAARSRPGARVASYALDVLALDPLRVSCECADFVRSSLGLCKHALTVLDELGKRGRLDRADQAPVAASKRPRLVWSFLHPLTGSADRLARLELVPGASGAALPGFRAGTAATRELRDPAKRLALIARMERAIARATVSAEPAVARLLAEERARAERVLRAASEQQPAMRSLAELRRKLYPYQREGVKRFLAEGRLLLADDMGLGKTTQAIAGCHALYATRRVRHGLLIVPAALKSQWKREWDATTRAPLTIVDGSPGERAKLYARRDPGFLVMGYEQLLRDFTHIERYAPELVVLDEAQRIKNWQTKSAAYVKALQPSYRLVLTGTPMENRFDELASIMDFVDDIALEPKWRLTPWHSLQQGNAHQGVGGARNLDTLRARLAPVMLRRVRREVLSQLPPRTDTRVPVELTEPQRERHDDLRRPIAALLARAAHRPLTQPEFLQLMQLLTKQRMICNGLAQIDFEEHWPRCGDSPPSEALLAGLFAPKLAALRSLVAQVVIQQRRKAVVFSQWRNMLRLAEWVVRDVLAADRARAVFFTGAESSKLRERAIIELHDDPDVRVMFLSDAGGVGLNLQRAATCCVNLELPWNPAVLEQRIGRIYRLGQDHPIDVYNLVTDEGIESRIAQLVANKKAVFSSLFDGTTDEVRFEGAVSFLETLKALGDAVTAPAVADLGEDAELGAATAPQAAALDQVATAPPAADLTRVLSRLSLARLPNGGVRIDAPPELAAPLANLLEDLARSLRDQPAAP